MTGGLTAIIALSLGPPIHAHHWYPKQCCHDHDCFPIVRMVQLANGSTIATAGPIQVIIPPGFPKEPSLDHDAHVCVYYDPDMQMYRPRCLFVPAEV